MEEDNKFQDVAFEICDVLDNNKGQDILLLDVGKMSSVANYFVVVTATSKPHTHALMDSVEEALSKRELSVLRRDGVGDGRWVVLDYGDIVVHIFTPDVREFYHLEKLWATGKNTFTIDDISKIREQKVKELILENKKAEKEKVAEQSKIEKKQKKEQKTKAKNKDKEVAE